MAALQKIRNKGALLIGAIGLALFAFIAEEFFRSLETTSNVNKQQVGEVYGEKLSVQEFQTLVEEASNFYKLQYGNLTDDMQDRVRDEVWQNFLYYKIIEKEANKLGLIVTNEEVQNALREGSAQSLMRLQVLNRIGLPLFDQSGRFSVQALQDFLKQYKEMRSQAAQMNPEMLEMLDMANNMWLYTEKELRKELLMVKYQTLLQKACISNPVSAKMLFDENTTQSSVELAAVPYTTVEDKDVTVADSDLKALYEQYKENFYVPVETRDIKYIDVVVTASPADRAALDKKMHETYTSLKNGDDASVVVSKSKSLLTYVNAPLTKNVFPSEISAYLDTMTVGSTKAPFYSGRDNTLNVVKLVSRVQAPDSMLVRQMTVMGATLEETKTRTDSIMTALRGGASFKDMAAKYGQPTDSAWITSAQYENSMIDEGGAKYVTALNTAQINSLTTVEVGQANVIIQMLDRKAMKTKYNAAVVKCPIDFSKETYRDALNKFNRFVAENRTVEDIEKNAGKNGYVLRSHDDFTSNFHNVANVGGTKEVVRWIFDEAEEAGAISKLYECGANNDHILLVAMTGIHEKGYRAWNDTLTKENLRPLAVSQKKGELLMQKLAGVKDMAAAKQQAGVVVDTLTNVTFSNAPFISVAGVPEVVVAGAVAKTEAGKFCGPVQGSEGVYMFRVISRNEGTQTFNKEQYMSIAAQNIYRNIGGQFLQVLMKEADVIDNRYKF